MTDAQKITVAVAALGVLVAIAALTWQVISWRRTGSKISAKLAIGEVDDLGILRAKFVGGESTLTRLNQAPGQKPSKGKRRKRPEPEKLKKLPVNAVFVRNTGRTAVTVSRCHYSGQLAPDNGFTFEPQPGASAWGDHLPKRLDPGEEAILVHERVGMSYFLDQVLSEHGVIASVFYIVLTLGSGEEVLVDGCMRAWGNASEEERAKYDGLLIREEVEEIPDFIPPPRRFGRDRRQSLILRKDAEE
ncbi:hypothetical protein [Micromonospora sp. NPDC092111]|uniref:hypothetical protein n=1 Tax=Micromonospora sp. NPDC092111 TaxID=3364289 RepID=UPI0038188DB0